MQEAGGQDGDQERVLAACARAAGWELVHQMVWSRRAQDRGGRREAAWQPCWTVLVRELSVSCPSSWGSLLCTPPNASTARLSQPSVPAAQPAQSGAVSGGWSWGPVRVDMWCLILMLTTLALTGDLRHSVPPQPPCPRASLALSHVICPVPTHLSSPTGWTLCPVQGLGTQEPRLKAGQHLAPSRCEGAWNVPGAGRLGAEGQRGVWRTSCATRAGAQEL